MSDLTGIVQDLDERFYHAHDSLSSTGARKLLESPAKFHHAQAHPQEPKAAFDLGTAAHTKILGVGAGVVAYPDEHLTKSGNVSTAAATVAWAEVQRTAGLTPISPKDMAAVDAMAESVLAHPVARELLEQEGNAEASVFATDPDTGVRMRARFDFLPNFMQDNPCTVDLKTTAKSAAPEEFAKTVAGFGYHIQQEWYLHAYGIAAGDFTARMKFVVVETAAPYLVGVYELAPEFAELALARVRKALATYKVCADANIWPGYPHDTDPLQPPNWLIYQEGIEFN
jgi:hypothetical protein